MDNIENVENSENNYFHCYFLPLFAALMYLVVSFNPVRNMLKIGIPHRVIRVITIFFIIFGACFIFCRLVDLFINEGKH